MTRIRPNSGANEAQVAQTEAALRAAAEINSATQKSYPRLRNGVSGTLTSANSGRKLRPRRSLRLRRTSPRCRTHTNVDEADVGRVALGQDVEFSVDAYPDRIFHGAISQIRIAPITVQNVVTYDVVITVDNADLNLKPWYDR